MKRFFSVLLSLALFFSIMLLAFASDDHSSAKCTDSTVDVITESAFQSLFVDDKQRNVSAAEIEEVLYSYSIVPRQDNPLMADVTLDFILSIGSNDYPVITKGTVDAYALSSGDTFWEGPIYGDMVINNIDYSVIAGFSKLHLRLLALH